MKNGGKFKLSHFLTQNQITFFIFLTVCNGRSQPLSQMPPLQPLVLQQHPQFEQNGLILKQDSPQLQVNSPKLQQSFDPEMDTQTGQIQTTSSKGLFARLIDVSRDEVRFQKF